MRGDWYSESATLIVDNMVVLCSGLAPRSDPTSISEVRSVTNVAGDTYRTGDKVYADYNAKDGVWESRPKGGSTTERYRALRGKWKSGDSLLIVDHIEPLDSGLDPRTNPTSETETVAVANVPNDTYATDDTVYADYNAGRARWESRPKSGVKLITFICRSAISAATYTSGPTVNRAEFDGEVCELDTTTGKVTPTGDTITFTYGDGISLPDLATGYVYMGEALQIGGADPVVLAIYCKEWAEAGE